MPSVTLALLPSPLLGPSTWAPVAGELAAAGWVSTIPHLPASATSGADVLEAMAGALPPHGEVVLVAHSNAGLYLPALSASASVVGHLFVDAGVPPPSGRVPLAPPAFLDFLTGLADDDGLLPPWTRWWPEPNTVTALPERVREAVRHEARRLPLSYFHGSLPVPVGWTDAPAAYLAFGETYAEDRARAADLGWRTRTMDGEHLHLLEEPVGVASAIGDLLERLGATPG